MHCCRALTLASARLSCSKYRNSTYSILAYLLTAMLYDDTINVILCLLVMFCFNGFNRFTWFNMPWGRMNNEERSLSD